MALNRYKIKVKNSNGTVSVRGDITASSQEEADKRADDLSKNTGFKHFAEFVEEVEADEAEAEEVEEVEEEVEDSEEEEVEEEEVEEEEEDRAKVSTDMNATEAVDHIEANSLEDLEGFVPEDEDRVTVTRAWKTKKEEG